MLNQHHPYLKLQPEYKGTDISHLEAWGSALANAIETKCNLEDWLLIGRAVTIICGNYSQAEEALKKVASIANMDFMSIKADDIANTFLAVECGQYLAPTMVLLEYGEWSNKYYGQEDDRREEIEMLQKNIIKAIQNASAEQPIVFACVMEDMEFNSFNNIFKHAGLFDTRFIINKPSLQQLGEHFIEAIGTELCDDSITKQPEKVGALIKGTIYSTREEGIYAINLIRRAKQYQRQLCFTDLVEVLLSGIGIGFPSDFNNKEVLNHIATHEAGHALMAILDSDGQDIPEYISTLKSENFAGIVLESCDHHINAMQHTPYKVIRHSIRVALAGRAAEELIFGVENVDFDCSETDLRNANMACYRLFRSCGVSPVIEQEIAASKLLPNSNLLAYIELEQTDMHKYHTTKIITKYLQQQNQWVREKLKQQLPLLKTISGELVKKRVLVQIEILKIMRETKVDLTF